MSTDTTQTPLPSTYIGRLQEAIRFSDADAAINRTGQISGAQKKRLERAWTRLFLVGASGVFAIILAATFAFYMAQRQNSAVMQIMGIALTVFNAFLLGKLAQSRMRVNGDVRGVVIRSEGVIRHTVRVTGRSANYLLEINGERLLVEKPVFFAFDDGKRYALYRTAVSQTLVSAEKLEH